MIIDALQSRWKSSSRTERLTFGAAAIVIVGCLFAVALWDQYYRDTLTAHIPTDTVSYVHISLPRLPASGLAHLTDELLADYGINNAALVRREVGLVVFGNSQTPQSALLVRTNNSRALKRQATAAGVTYIKLGREQFALMQGSSTFPIIGKEQAQPITPRETRGDNVTVFIGSNNNAANPLLAIFKTNSNEATLIHGKAFIGGVAFGAERPKRLPQKLMPTVVLQLQQPQGYFDQWQRQIKALSTTTLDQITQWHQAAAAQFGLNPETTNLRGVDLLHVSASATDRATGWALQDYDWQLMALGSDPVVVQERLEELVSGLVAAHIPQPVTRRLSDSSLITELRPQPENWVFDETDGARALAIESAGLTVSVGQQGNQIVITNNEAFKVPSEPTSGNLAWLPISLMAPQSIERYLAKYKYILATDEQITLFE
ncbi:MAG: hypothetical protein KBB55_03550 [Candidatus Buchananbacteria bacterium]|nr:hypothetical protein [Candidatus Buchananbacteria bacterium]